MMVGMGLRYRSTKSLFWVSLRRPLMVGCRCRSHRNRRRIFVVKLLVPMSGLKQAAPEVD